MKAAPSLPAQAGRLADRSIAATVAQVRQQQAAELAQARARARQITLASQGAAHFLTGLGDKTASDYRAAVGNEVGLASGYTGQLRTDAEAAAKAANASLASVPGNTQQVTDRGPSLANLLYGLGGDIPADATRTAGLGATAAARALPAGTLGYGMQESYGALGAGKTAADSLNPQIAAARGQRGSLTEQYLAQLRQDARDQQLYPYLIDKAKKDALAPGTTIDPNTGKVIAIPAKPTRGVVVGSDKSGRNLVDPVTGETISQVTPPVVTAKKAAKPTAHEQIQTAEATSYATDRSQPYYTYADEPWTPISGVQLRQLAAQANLPPGAAPSQIANRLGLHTAAWTRAEMQNRLRSLGYTPAQIAKALKGFKGYGMPKGVLGPPSPPTVPGG